VIVVFDPLPVCPKPGKRLGGDVLGGVWVERDERASSDDSAEVLPVEGLERLTIGH
jgi:hypothetical protein